MTDPKGLLDLPSGFRYQVLSRAGTAMFSGEQVPGHCDGMGAFADEGGAVRLLRNHENYADAQFPVLGAPGLLFDPAANGGTTTLTVDSDGRLRSDCVSLAGTAVNCAGGVTPWNTWLSCEETEERVGESGYTRDHGWIFEVDPFDQSRNLRPTPLAAMGRLRHEAVCVDPRTGVVYETEDAAGPYGCFYRFLPRRPLGGHGSLRLGGQLQAMHVPDLPDLSVVTEAGASFGGVRWVDVPDPLAGSDTVRTQVYDHPVSRAQKLEGAWWGDSDQSAYFVSSYARVSEGSGAEHDGQVWRYDPSAGALTLVVVFTRRSDTPEEQLFQTPDNICMTPSGGLMLCQDGGGDNYLMGATLLGEPYLFARNRHNIGTDAQPAFAEFAGVCFSPDARTLYVNVYDPGATFAIRGPWLDPECAAPR